MRKAEWAVLGIVAFTIAVSVWFYPLMPDMMASHWNANWEVDRHVPKFWGMVVAPLVSVLLFPLFLVIPKIDPLRANVDKFRKHFDRFIALIFLFLLYIHMLIICANLDIGFSFAHAFLPAFAVLFYYCGILVENDRRNWFIGIRTPWTMSSDRVWDKTHRVGGKLFKACGLISLLGLIFMDYAVWLILVPVLVLVVYLFAYSYFEYKRLSGKK